MRKNFSLLLVLVLTLSLVFCFGASAWAAQEVSQGTILPEGEEVPTDEEPTEEEPTEEEPLVDEPVEEPAPEEEFVIPVPEKVVVSSQALTIDGELVEAEAYNIDGSNYFKLRDLAALFAGTGSQFNVTYEAPNMIVTTGEAYTPIDGDLVKGEDKSATCVPSTQVLLVDGVQAEILVYNIGGNNFFQLRGLDALLGFTVGYDEATRTMIVETAPADVDEEAPVDEEVPVDGDPTEEDPTEEDPTEEDPTEEDPIEEDPVEGEDLL